jgi:hypothetical protein
MKRLSAWSEARPGTDNKERHEACCGAVVTKKLESCLSEFSVWMLLREVEGRNE